MRTRTPTETQEQAVIASYFRKSGLGGGALALHIRNERGSAWERMIAAKAGVLHGVPDWLILHEGDAGFIELKSRGWKARKARTGKYNAHEERQLRTHDRLREAGCWVEICESLEEVLQTLWRHGIATRHESTATERIRRGFMSAMKEDAE